MLKGFLENTECTLSPPVSSSATLQSTRASSSTPAASTTRAVSTTNAVTSARTASSSASTLTSGTSLPAMSSGSLIPTSSGGVIVSITKVSTVSSCPPNVRYCPFSSQALTSSASSTSKFVYTSESGPSFSSAAAVTSSVPAPAKSGTTIASVNQSTPASASTYSPSGALSTGLPSRVPSVDSSGLSSSLPVTGLYQNTTSTTGSPTFTPIVPLSTTTPILSGTNVSPVPESTSFSTYTTVTSCPVTTTRVLSGTTSIIVETSLITSTITRCPRCSETTKSAIVSGPSSITPGSPGELGTTTPAPLSSILISPSTSAVLISSPRIAPAGQSSGHLPSLTTYTTTEVVSTLITTCSAATTFSLSSSGRVYSATVVCSRSPTLVQSLLTMFRMRLSPFLNAHAHLHTRPPAMLFPPELALLPTIYLRPLLEISATRMASLLVLHTSESLVLQVLQEWERHRQDQKPVNQRARRTRVPALLRADQKSRTKAAMAPQVRNPQVCRMPPLRATPTVKVVHRLQARVLQVDRMLDLKANPTVQVVHHRQTWHLLVHQSLDLLPIVKVRATYRRQQHPKTHLPSNQKRQVAHHSQGPLDRCRRPVNRLLQVV